MHLVPKENDALLINDPCTIWIDANKTQSWNIEKVKIIDNNIYCLLQLDCNQSIINPVVSLPFAMKYFDVYDSHGHVIEKQRDIMELIYDECQDESTREDLLDMF